MHVRIKKKILPGTSNYGEMNMAVIKTSPLPPQQSSSRARERGSAPASNVSITDVFQGQLWIKKTD